MTTVLEVEDLHTEFRLRRSTVRAVDGVSFSVEAGECLGIVGESGCGKTTSGLSIMQLLPNVGHVTAGSIRLEGRDLVPLSEREMGRIRGNEIGMIFQDPSSSLNPTMTIGRQIAESVRLHRDVTRDEATARALGVLRLVEMPRPEERLAVYPHQLSGGLRQRVMIAMALACEPKVLIADEPTTALDVTIQAQILDLIDGLRERLEMAVILITHDMGVIAGRSDRVLVMYGGRIIERADTEELVSRMRHPYSEALLASVPRLDQPRDVPLASIPGRPPDLSQPVDHCRFAPRCRSARENCWEASPDLVPVPDSGGDHLVACYHPVDVVPTGNVAIGTVGARRASGPEELDSDLRTREGELSGGPVLVEVAHLVKEFPVNGGGVLQRRVGSVKAVSDVSFAVRTGETFGLVGESGCGKTTVARLLVSLDRADGGSISFDGRDVRSLRGGALRRSRRDRQLMFQDPSASLDPRMRISAILAEPLVVQGMGSRAERRRRVEDLLAEVGLPAQAGSRYPHEFSGGQIQRIGLARALALEPRLVVADEPVSSLDVSIQAQILNLLKELQRSRGLTYVVISHDLAVVRYLADTIGVMYLGKLVECAPAEDIYTRTVHPYTRALIDAIPELDVVRVRADPAPHIRGEPPSAMWPPSGCRFRTRCPLAQEICADSEPPLQRFGRRHVAACHFPLRAPVEGGPTVASSTIAG